MTLLTHNAQKQVHKRNSTELQLLRVVTEMAKRCRHQLHLSVRERMSACMSICVQVCVYVCRDALTQSGCELRYVNCIEDESRKDRKRRRLLRGEQWKHWKGRKGERRPSAAYIRTVMVKGFDGVTKLLTCRSLSVTKDSYLMAQFYRN